MLTDFRPASPFHASLRRQGEHGSTLRLLAAILELADGQAELVRNSERPWTSVTFSGSRHRVVLAFSGEDAVAAGEYFVAALPDHEFALPGQLVADAAVAAVDHEWVPEPYMTVETEFLLLAAA